MATVATMEWVATIPEGAVVMTEQMVAATLTMTVSTTGQMAALESVARVVMEQHPGQ